MINCILVSDLHNINEIRAKNITCENLYKKCNYKNNENFVKLKDYNYKSNIIELWGKNKGQNKYKNNNKFFINENIDIFGKALFVMVNNNNYISLTQSFFNDFYNNILNIKEDKPDKANEVNQVNEANEANEANETNEADKDNKINNDTKNHDNDSEYSYNSELSYDLYCYSDDENSL